MLFQANQSSGASDKHLTLKKLQVNTLLGFQGKRSFCWNYSINRLPVFLHEFIIILINMRIQSNICLLATHRKEASFIFGLGHVSISKTRSWPLPWLLVLIILSHILERIVIAHHPRAQCRLDPHLFGGYLEASIFFGPSFLIFLVLSCISRQVPTGVHHLREIGIVVDARGYVCVVFNELFPGNFIIILSLLRVVMVLLESAEKFFQHFIFSLPALQHRRMILGIVDANDVFNFDSATMVPVKLVKCSVY